jgi:hypothetical protein
MPSSPLPKRTIPLLTLILLTLAASSALANPSAPLLPFTHHALMRLLQHVHTTAVTTTTTANTSLLGTSPSTAPPGGGGTYEQCLNSAALAQINAGYGCLECMLGSESPLCARCCVIPGPTQSLDKDAFICEVGRCCTRLFVRDGGVVASGERLTARGMTADGECRDMQERAVCQECALVSTDLGEPVDCTAAGVEVPRFGDRYRGEAACADGSRVVPPTFTKVPPTSVDGGASGGVKEEHRCTCECDGR